MATLEKTRLFNVRCGAGANVIYSGIEAETAEDAIRKSGKGVGQTVTAVDSEPIYTAGLDVETEDWDNENDTGTSIFEIKVRGTNPELVDKLKEAIALAVGGMAVAFENLNPDGESDHGRALQALINKLNLSITAM